ncbi:unnamed protein product [Penicillium nalgiovense]|nr:unnamed protein product [Penicillium nalgiovense]
MTGDSFHEVERRSDRESYPGESLYLTEMLSKGDVSRLRSLNGSPPLQEDSCIHELIRRRCLSQPADAAVCAWDGDLSYRDLDQLSSQLATQLISRGTGPNSVVATLLNKSKWTPVVVLAILKTGGAFVLLDSASPLPRLNQACETSRARLIVCSNALVATAKRLGPEVLPVCDEQFLSKSSTAIVVGSLGFPSSNLAYVVFTSGSTGKPKGVQVSHRSFCSMARPYIDRIGYSRQTRALAFSSYAFDVSISDMLIPLIAGGCICIPSESDLLNNLPRAAAHFRANFADMTPTLLRTLRPEQIPSFRTIVVGGEPVSQDVMTTWGPHVTLVNVYGPAECAINATVNVGVTPQTDSSNVGLPIGARLWIVHQEDQERLMPIGTAGELLIEGPIVGDGYANDPEQTAGAFIEPPRWLAHFRHNSFSRKLYKTGDRGSIQPDGSLKILGRKDTQVKLRGQRIELSEIEHHVHQRMHKFHSVVAEIISPLEGDRSAYLAVFLCDTKLHSASNQAMFAEPTAHARAQVVTAHNQLNSQLPGYMLPGVFLNLSSLPLTATGKLDRRRLQAEAASLSPEELFRYNLLSAVGRREPSNPTESQLQQIWAQVLSLPREVIGVDEDFFRLRGDSFSAMQVAKKARAAGLTCQVADIFRCKTISVLARSLGEVTQSRVGTPEEQVEEPFCPTSTPQPFLGQLLPKQLSNFLYYMLPEIGVLPATVKDAYPCSPIQRGMLISQSQDPEAYNCRIVCQITSRTKPVDLIRVADSWQQVIQRHDILRTIFMGNVIGTGYHDQVVLKKVTADIDMLGRIEDTATMEKAFGAGVTFPGGRQPMHRLTLWSVPAGDAFCKLEISHTLIDAISMDIILRDISRAYNGQLRGSPGLQYGDYIAMLQSQSDEPNRHYWVRYLEHVEPCLFPRLNQSSQDDDKAEWKSLSLDIELDSTWWNYCEAHSVTSAHIFQVAWGLVLRCYTGCDQVCFGYLNSGRDVALPGVDDGVGPFINLLVSRMLLEPGGSLRQVMQQSQADFSQALGHQNFVLADVFHSLNLSGNALFNTGMSLYRIQSGKHDNAPASTISLETIDGGDNPEHDVAVLIGMCEDIATITFTCRTKIISEMDMAKLGEAFREAASVIIATDPDSVIGKLPLFSRHSSRLVSQRIWGMHEAEKYWQSQMDNYSGEAFPTLPPNCTPKANASITLSAPKEEGPYLSDDKSSCLLQLAWAVVISQYAGSDDVLFQVMDAGLEDGVAPMRIRIDPSDLISDKLRAIKEDREFRRYLQRCTAGTTPASYRKLAAVCQSHNLLVVQQSKSKVTSMAKGHEGVGFALVVSCRLFKDNTTKVQVHFDDAWIDSMQAQRFGYQLSHIVGQLIQMPTKRIGDVRTLSPRDIEQLGQWNSTVPTPVEMCVHDVIYNNAAAHPEAPAVCAWDGEFTYKQLDEYATRLAWRLKDLHVRPGVVVPICQEKTCWTAVAILAVLKAGGAFTLLSPTLPSDRLAVIGHDLSAPVAISTSQSAPVCHQLAAEVIISEDLESAQFEKVTPLPQPSLCPANPLYVVYTSGSTGKPKGVVISHTSYITGAISQDHVRFIGPSSRALQFASYMFDVSVADYLRTLLAGGCVCVPREDELKDNLVEVIRRLHVNRMDITPSVLRLLSPEAIPSVKTITVGGEALARKDVERWSQNVQLINCYGPAECSYCVTASQILSNRSDPVNIGRSLGAICWVVDPDDHRKLVPIGAVGELVVEGPLVGSGYLHNHQMTAKAFITDSPPWLSRLGRTGTLYKSGDLVQYCTDGSFRFIGRKDTQVKIYGQRLELGEVEYHVGQCFPHASEVIAEVVQPSLPGDEAQTLLAAFVWTGETNSKDDQAGQVLRPPTAEFIADAQQARQKLSQRIPGYMVPRVFIPVNRIPLTQNGKVDRRLLRLHISQMSREELSMSPTSKEKTKRAPTTKTEHLLRTLISQVLKKHPDEVGMDDDVFQLGMDSVVVFRFVLLAKQHGLDIAATEVFRRPKISDLAESYESARESTIDEPLPITAPSTSN